MNPSAKIDQALASLITEEDISQIVDSFCKKAQHSPVFREGKTAWEKHRSLMHQFMRIILPGASSSEKIVSAPFVIISQTKDQVENWFRLFSQTLQEHFSGLILDIAEDRAASIFASHDSLSTKIAC